MKTNHSRSIRLAVGAGALVMLVAAALPVRAATDAQDLGDQVPDAAAVKEGLFPEDACKELEAAGFKCMGFKPAVRYALPGASFRVGSADLPDMLRRQLDVFASVLSGKKGTGRVVRVEGPCRRLGHGRREPEPVTAPRRSGEGLPHRQGRRPGHARRHRHGLQSAEGRP